MLISWQWSTSINGGLEWTSCLCGCTIFSSLKLLCALAPRRSLIMHKSEVRMRQRRINQILFLKFTFRKETHLLKEQFRSEKSRVGFFFFFGSTQQSSDQYSFGKSCWEKDSVIWSTESRNLSVDNRVPSYVAEHKHISISKLGRLLEAHWLMYHSFSSPEVHSSLNF